MGPVMSAFLGYWTSHPDDPYPELRNHLVSKKGWHNVAAWDHSQRHLPSWDYAHLRSNGYVYPPLRTLMAFNDDNNAILKAFRSFTKDKLLLCQCGRVYRVGTKCDGNSTRCG